MQSFLRVAFLLFSTEAFLVAAVHGEQRRLVRKGASEELIDADGTVHAFTGASPTGANVALSVSAGGKFVKTNSIIQKALSAPARGQKLLAEVEEMVRSGTKVDPEKIKVISDLVTEELIPDLKATHETAVKQIALNLATINTCNTGGTQKLQTISTETETQVGERRTSHSTCREEEKEKHGNQEAKCNELDAFLDKIVVPANLPAGKPRDGMVDYVTTMSTYFCPKGPTVTDLDEACTKAEDENKDHKAKCDQKQASFESSFCIWRTEILNTCEDLKTCYDGSVAIFNAFVADTKELVTKWKVEWSALQKILCYTNVWASAKTEDMAAQYATCNAATPDTSEMDVEYPAVPAKIECATTAVDTYPGGGGFGNAEYSEFKDFANEVIPCVEHAATPAA